MGKNSKGRRLGQAMKYFVEGLPKKQINVLKALGSHMASKGFYLAGGTLSQSISLKKARQFIRRAPLRP
jgi:hypothetical protein